MKVWAVEYCDKGYSWVLREIFSSEEKANKWIAEQYDPQNYFANEWIVDETKMDTIF